MASNAKNLAELLNQDTTVAVGDIADGSVTTAKLADNAVTTAKITDGNITTAKVADGAVTQTKTTSVGGGNGKNILINGEMTVAQRGTSSTGLGAASGYFTCDRWSIAVPTQDGRFTMSQSTDTPDGFANSLKLDCTTADTSTAAGEYLILRQLLEGKNLQRFAKGTSSAKKHIVSFYAKVTGGAYSATCELYDADNNRAVSKEFAVASSWSRITLDMGADTTGAYTNDNNTSLYVNFWLHAGSDFTSGTLGTSWRASPANNTRVSSTAPNSFFNNTNRELYITGVQLEVDDVTDFEHRSFAEELTLCQRYYLRKNASSDAYTTFAQGYIYNSTNGHFRTEFPTTMRATPSFGSSGTFRLIAPNADNLTSFLLNHASLDSASFDCGVSGGHGESNGNGGLITASNDANAYIRFDAEL